MHPNRKRFAVLSAAVALVAAGAFLDPDPAMASADPDPGWGEMEQLNLEPDPFAGVFHVISYDVDEEFLLFAHDTGSVSPKDGCHKQDGERHWHVEGTDGQRGGPCIKQDGVTYPLTKHAICAAARIKLVEAKEEWYGDFEAAAEALKDCIIDLEH